MIAGRTDIHVAGIVWHSIPGNCVAEYSYGNGQPWRGVFLIGDGTSPSSAEETEAIREACRACFVKSQVSRHVREMVERPGRERPNYMLRWDFDKKTTYIEKRGVA